MGVSQNTGFSQNLGPMVIGSIHSQWALFDELLPTKVWKTFFAEMSGKKEGEVPILRLKSNLGIEKYDATS